MAEVNSGNTASVSAVKTGVRGNAHVFKTSAVGQLIYISSNTGGWVQGIYEIGSMDTQSNTVYLTTSPCPSARCTNGSFALGPTRTTWVFVNPTNTLPHWGKDGSRLSSYDSSKSFMMAELFGSSIGYSDLVYNTPDTVASHSGLGFGTDFDKSGFNTIEFGYPDQPGPGDTSSSWHRQELGNLNSQISMVAPWPKTRFFITGDNLTSADGVYYATRGPCASFTTPCLQDAFQILASSSVPIIGGSWHDEINDAWQFAPLQGPIQFVAAPTTQSGLTSITGNGATCTAAWTAYSLPRNFVIHGSANSALNSTTGNTVAPSHVDKDHFTFPCNFNGKANSSNDSGLRIEPYGEAWHGSDYTRYDVWANIRAQSTAGGNTSMSGSNAAGTIPLSVANWGGNGIQSIGAVAQMGDFADFYWSHGGENYLATRSTPYALISDIGDPIEEGFHTRSYYGNGYSPDKPLSILVQGTTSNYGLQAGPPISISSISGSTITFASPHNISVVNQGDTRLWITGSSNSAYNTNFYATGILSPTQVGVALAATDFNPGCTGSGGTATFSDSGTKAISSLCATGLAHGEGGDQLTYAGSPDSNMPRKRGQTFTLASVTGTGASTWNTRTFILSSENIDTATDSNGSASSVMYYRELPTGSSTGGSASILTDNTYVKGRSLDISGSNEDPGFALVSLIEAAINRAAGFRAYKLATSTDGRNPHYRKLSNGIGAKGGLAGLFSSSMVTTFNDPNTTNQLFIHPKYENGMSVPMFHALNQGLLLIAANQKYILQPSMSAPDYGDKIDCGARSGANGAILMCVNGTAGPQTRTFNLSPFLQSGQQIARYSVGPRHLRMTVIAAGTTSDTFTLNPDDDVFYAFPASFTTDVTLPIIHMRLSDVTNATQFVIRYGYDRYTLDQPTASVQLCSASPCQLQQNSNVGTIYYRIIYLDSENKVLATSDVQTF
jgi:hypothetical protein